MNQQEPQVALTQPAGPARGAGEDAAYFRELGRHRNVLAGAFLGMGFGYTLNNYLANLFIPAMIREFGWNSSQIALLGSAAMLSLLSQPLAGRAIDRLGPQRIALFGMLTASAVFLAFSLMSGAFWQFAALVIAQIAFVAPVTAGLVFSRPIAERFTRARGLALALATTAPSIVGLLIVAPLSHFIDAAGWRAGYRLVAIVSLVLGLSAVALLPRARSSHGIASAAVKSGGDRFCDILRNGNVAIILAGMALGSLSITFQTTQLKVAILAAGFDEMRASAMLSVYAAGVAAGRMLSGVALDFLPTKLVASLVIAVPGFGLLALATGGADPWLFHVAILFLGLSLGAEGDIAGYLVMTYLPARNYSACLGLVIGTIAFSAGVGSLILSVTYRLTASFDTFLGVAGVAALAGGAVFMLLRPSTGGGTPSECDCPASSADTGARLCGDHGRTA